MPEFIDELDKKYARFYIDFDIKVSEYYRGKLEQGLIELGILATTKVFLV